MFLTHDPTLAEQRVARHFAFPTLQKVLDSVAFQDRPFPFYGGQPINKIFVEAGREVDGSFQWSPFQDYVHSSSETKWVPPLADAVRWSIRLIACRATSSPSPSCRALR